jgi:hypothetical protein
MRIHDVTGEVRNRVQARLVVHSKQNDLQQETDMSVEGKIKEAAGYVKEEMNEHGKSPESQKKAEEGRALRNEGRVEDGKAPKLNEPGTGDKSK